MFGCVGVLLAGLTLASAAPQGAPAQASPPIFQPGAPGTAARVITAGQAVELSRTTFIAADAAFMQHMIVHHAQAVEMVELLKTRSRNPTVQLVGRRIALSQEAEMALMRDWLTTRDQPLEMPGRAGMDHAGMADMPGMSMTPSDMPVMPGMLSPARMQLLAAADGPAFDRLFLTGMIQHHQGALGMIDALLARPGAAEDPLLSDFTTSVVADQSAEILRMQSILSDL